MASLGHIAVGLAAGRAYAGNRKGARGVMALLGALSLAPDLDVVGMRLGVPYGAPWGHRGATHSLAMAVVVGLVLAVLLRRKHAVIGFAPLVIAVLASHGLLDAMTDGGHGVALLWPWSNERFFLGWRPIPVAPIGARLVSRDGLHVLFWEAAVFAPAWFWALWPRRVR